MKLTYTKENNKEIYKSNSKKVFLGFELITDDVNKAFNFAYEMCLGDGHHRANRTGGQYGRSNGEKFCNTFQGKLAEIVLYNYFKSQGLDVNEPDFGVYGEGIWDDSDLEIKDKKINVKSAAFFSNLLLLETKDWNSNGQYIPNIKAGSTSIYDYFILVRIKPDLKGVFKNKGLFNGNEFKKEEIEKIVMDQSFLADIAGYITHTDLVYLITNKYILPQNSWLNGSVRMDAENYYVQCGDMRIITDLVSELKAL